MTAVLVPPAYLVCVAWLKSLSILNGYVAATDIAQRCAADVTSWTHDYAIAVTTVSPDAALHAPLRLSVVQIDVYGRPVQTTSGSKLPWLTALGLGEAIADQTYNPLNLGVVAIGGDEMLDAKVGDISIARSPSFMDRSVSARLARVSLDVLVKYVPIYA